MRITTHPNQIVIDHYIRIDTICKNQFNSDISADEYCASADASLVALHYLSEFCTYTEFHRAMHHADSRRG